MNFTIRQVGIDEKELLQEIFKLRVTCRQEQGFITFDKFPNGWFDESDYTAHHFSVFDNNKLIASSRIIFYANIQQHPYFPAFENLKNLPDKSAISYLSRIVVLPEYRKQGISKMLVDTREKFASENNVFNVLADVTGFQIENFLNYGFDNIGMLDTSKIKWDLNPDPAGACLKRRK